MARNSGGRRAALDCFSSIFDFWTLSFGSLDERVFLTYRVTVGFFTFVLSGLDEVVLTAFLVFCMTPLLVEDVNV